MSNDDLTPEEVDALVQERAQRIKAQRMKAHRNTAGAWINAGQIMATLYMLAGVVGGIAIAVVTGTEESYYGYEHTTHPFVGYGIGLIAFAITTWTVIMAVLAYLGWRVDEAGDNAAPGAVTPAPTAPVIGAWG